MSTIFSPTEESTLKQTYPSQKSLPVLIYEPGSQLRHPRRLFRQMWSDMLKSKDLAVQLFQRDIQVQYRQSVLGVLWAFIPPVVTALAATVVRGALNLETFTNTAIPYTLYVMFSTSLWQVFQGVLVGTISGVRKAKAMMKKIRVPPEAFVLSRVGDVLFKFAIQLIVFIGFVIAYNLTGNPVALSWKAILAPVAFIHLIFLAMGIGLLLAPWAALYGDVMMLLNYILRGLFFITPILWVPKEQGITRLMVELNPIYFLLGTTRDLVMTGVVSQPIQFWIASIVALILLLIGWVFNRVAIPILIERGM